MPTSPEPKSKKITSFDLANVRELDAAIMEALKKVGEAYGVEFKEGRGRWTPTRYECRLDVLTAGTEPQEVQDFRQCAAMIGLKPEDLGRAFFIQGRRLTIVGLLPRSLRYPILAEDGDGTRCKVAVETVKAGFNAD